MPIRRFVLFPLLVPLSLGYVLPGHAADSPSASARTGLVTAPARAASGTDRWIEQIQARLRAAPTDAQAYRDLGLAHLQKARETGDPSHYQKAETAFAKALAARPDDDLAVAGMGALALARHQFAAALEWGERARRLNPDRGYALGVIADAQIELGRYEDAAATLQTMVDRRPDSSAYARISYWRELHGDFAGAVEIMRLAADSGGANAENAAWSRNQLGNLYFNRGDLAQAEQEYLRALTGLPGYVYALAGLGRVRFAQGRGGEAIDLLTQAARTVPLPEFVITLGDLHQALGNAAAAREQYALVAVMQQLLEANGVDTDLEMALFNADHDRDLEKTLRQARAAYARRPSVHAADVLAWVLYKNGAYAEAREYAEKALRLGTEDAQILFHAGLIARALGDTTQAKRHLERALALNPHFSIRHAALARDTLGELTALAQR